MQDRCGKYFLEIFAFYVDKEFFFMYSSKRPARTIEIDTFMTIQKEKKVPISSKVMPVTSLAIGSLASDSKHTPGAMTRILLETHPDVMKKVKQLEREAKRS